MKQSPRDARRWHSRPAGPYQGASHAAIFAALLALVLLLIAGAGCTGRDANGRAMGGSKGGAKGGFAMPPTPVEMATVTGAPMTDRFEAVGTLEPDEGITVASEIDGLVVDLPFQEGSALQRGDLIAQLDDSQLKADVDRATALRDQSKATYDRVRAVVEQKAGSQQDLDDAAASLKVAEANLALSRARLAKTRITAPFDGMVGARRVSPGAFLRAGQSITDLARIRRLRVTFSAPERFLPLLRKGAEVTVSTTAFPGVEVKGLISVVEPVLDASTRSARIVALMDNPEDRFRPGMSANISAVMRARDNALSVPNEAIFVEGDQAYVYMIKPDSTVTRMALTLGTRTSDRVEVLKGLESGSRVVRAGHQKLYEGAKVAPVESRAAEEKS